MGMTPMMSLSSCVILLMLVSNSYAKSLILNDVPGPPKRSSFRPPLARTAPFARQYFSKKRQEPVDKNTLATNALKEPKRPPFSAVYELSVKIRNAPQPLPVIKFQSLARYDHPQEEDKTSSQRGEHGGESIMLPDQVKDDTLKLLGEAATTGVSTIISTKAPIVTTTEATTVKPTVTKIPTTTVTAEPTTTVTAEPTTTTTTVTAEPTTTVTVTAEPTTTTTTVTAELTTTVTVTAEPTTTVTAEPTTTTTTTTTTKPTTEDPWEAFCNEACQEGLAGPECDCAEHPIG